MTKSWLTTQKIKISRSPLYIIIAKRKLRYNFSLGVNRLKFLVTVYSARP